MPRWTRRHSFKIGDRVLFTREKSLADDLYTLGLIETHTGVPPSRATVVAIPVNATTRSYVIKLDDVVGGSPYCECCEESLAQLPVLDRLAEL